MRGIRGTYSPSHPKHPAYRALVRARREAYWRAGRCTCCTRKHDGVTSRCASCLAKARAYQRRRAADR